MTGVIVAVPDPEATATQVGRRVRRGRIGRTHALDHDTSISFVKSERTEDEGVCGIEVKAADRARAGEMSSICGIDVKFV
jgi:hypothetical protein